MVQKSSRLLTRRQGRGQKGGSMGFGPPRNVIDEIFLESEWNEKVYTFIVIR